MIVLKESHYKEIIGHCESSPDREVCGLVTGGGGNRALSVHQLMNTAPGRGEVDYVVDPQGFFDVASRTRLLDKDAEQELLAVYHSHPIGLPVPSKVDVARASYRIVYIIYSVQAGMMKAWRWDGKRFRPEEIELVGDE